MTDKADVSLSCLKNAVGGGSSRSPLETSTGTRHYSFSSPKISEIDHMLNVRNINSHIHWSCFVSVTGPQDGCILFLNRLTLTACCQAMFL